MRARAGQLVDNGSGSGPLQKISSRTQLIGRLSSPPAKSLVRIAPEDVPFLNSLRRLCQAPDFTFTTAVPTNTVVLINAGTGCSDNLCVWVRGYNFVAATRVTVKDNITGQPMLARCTRI